MNQCHHCIAVGATSSSSELHPQVERIEQEFSECTAAMHCYLGLCEVDALLNAMHKESVGIEVEAAVEVAVEAEARFDPSCKVDPQENLRDALEGLV